MIGRYRSARRIDATSVDYRYCADALFSTFTCPDYCRCPQKVKATENICYIDLR